MTVSPLSTSLPSLTILVILRAPYRYETFGEAMLIEFTERTQHEQFFNDMAKASVVSAMAYPHKKMINYFMTPVLVCAARKAVLGAG